jgi:hypothetical protein
MTTRGSHDREPPHEEHTERGQEAQRTAKKFASDTRPVIECSSVNRAVIRNPLSAKKTNRAA